MISRFFSWWFGELAALLPAGSRPGASSSGRVLVIELEGDEVRITVEGARGGSAVVPRGDGQRLSDAVQEVAAGLDPSRTRVQVRVPASLALITDPSLPLAAEENLREVLGFEMDRLTPFRANDVYFSYEVQNRDRVKQSLAVRLGVVRRSLVTPLLSGLESWALAPSAQGLGRGRKDDQGQQVFLDFAPASYRQRSAGGLNALLAVTVVVLAGLAVYLPIQAQREYRDTLETQLADARREAAQAMQVREQLELEAAAARILADAKGARPSAVEILDTLTRLLPDHTYLLRFELKGDELTIQGSSEAASSLIALLDGSAAMTGVQFVSPVTRDARSGGERFHITTKLLPPDGEK